MVVDLELGNPLIRRNYGLYPRAMLNLKLARPPFRRNYGLYPRAMLYLKLDGESDPHS